MSSELIKTCMARVQISPFANNFLCYLWITFYLSLRGWQNAIGLVRFNNSNHAGSSSFISMEIFTSALLLCLTQSSDSFPILGYRVNDIQYITNFLPVH